MDNKSLISDTVTLQAVRDFLSSGKPSSMQPVDVLHVIHLITRKAEDHEIYDSQQSLAQSFACDVRTIARSQQRLQKMKWLSRPQRRGRTNALSLVYENIPSEKAVRTLITQDAKQLSVRYMTDLRSMGRKKFPKAWLGLQFLSAQRILDKCDGDTDRAARMINYALRNPRFRNKARKSLYELLGRWRIVAQSYAEAFPTQTADQTRPIETVPSKRATSHAVVILTPSASPKIVHRGVNLMWNRDTKRLEDMRSGEPVEGDKVHQLIALAGLKRNLLTGEFIRQGTYESVPLDEVQERLMGTEAWSALGPQAEMEETQ